MSRRARHCGLQMGNTALALPALEVMCRRQLMNLRLFAMGEQKPVQFSRYCVTIAALDGPS